MCRNRFDAVRSVHHVAIEELAAAKMTVDGQVVVEALTVALLTFEQEDLQPVHRTPRSKLVCNMQRPKCQRRCANPPFLLGRISAASDGCRRWWEATVFLGEQECD